MNRRLILMPMLLLLLVTASGFREPLTWPAPPVGSGARVFEVPTTGGDWYGIPPTQDCELRMPSTPVSGMVKLDGCRNVRLVGGEFYNATAPCAANGDGETAALYLANFAGTAHVEGLKIHGRGFSDGIWLSSTLPASVAQIEGTWAGGLAACQEPASGHVGGWPAEHPDCLQTWAGPSVLRFDKNTCWTIYEGYNVDTANWADAAGRKYPAKLIDIRRTNVRLDERTPNGRQCFTAWNRFSPSPTRLQRVHCTPGNAGFEWVAPSVSQDPAWWSGVKAGRYGGRDEIEATEAGIGYRTPTTVELPAPGPGSGSGLVPAAPDAAKGVSGGLLVRVARRARAGRVLDRGLALSVTCPSACRVRARAKLSGDAARRLG
ncbi:MAG: hypothetical protein H0U84_00600, partial [Thermoleophilaceae bacterium]|nr:hypothetical protein [Thermoleophilaceae bacterium]